jgi:UDPglucose--hexose-1-phosphate uridylyltransferase
MSEFRRNSLTGQWVIFAENRDSRPQEIAIRQSALENFECPFCEGREERTPGETLAVRDPTSRRDGPGWRVRVVPNLFPAVGGGEHAKPQAAEGNTTAAGGLHEIIIESPRHLTSVTQLSAEQFAQVLDVYRQRLAALRQDGRYKSVALFKNSGTMGGATLSHVHGQLIAIESSASIFADRTPAFREQFQRYGNCLICEEIREEASRDGRLVAESEKFLVYCPHASRFAYEMWIVPRKHQSSFDQIDPAQLPELADLFRGMLVKLEAIVKLPAYNYIVQTGGFDTLADNHYHWHIEILPRITNLAGLELGSGCFINSILPEKAAAALRNA